MTVKAGGKRFVAIILTAVLTISLSIPGFAAGDSINNATALSFGANVKGVITNTNSVDCYRFSVNESGKVTLRASAEMEDIDYRIYNSAGEEVWNANYEHWDSTTKTISTNSKIDLLSGTYYFTAQMRYDSTGEYNAKLTFEGAGESFKESQNDNEGSMAKANAISVNKNYKGQIAQNDDVDFYRFNLAKSGRINFKASAGLEGINYRIYNSAGEEVWNANYELWDSTTKTISTNKLIDLTSGTYYLTASKLYDYTGNYSFNLNYTDAGESFDEKLDGSEMQAGNNSTACAQQIYVEKTYKGQIAKNDEVDFYKISLSQSGNYVLNASAGMEYINYRLYNSAGEEIWKKTYEYWNSTTKKSITNETIALTKGVYYFAAQRCSGETGNYSFSISKVKANNPQKVKANNSLKVKISSKIYKRSKLTKKKTFRIGVTKAKGKVTYTLNAKAKKAKIRVSNTGKVTVPRKCKKGTYKIMVKAAGNTNYKAAKKSVTIIIK